MCPHDRTSSGVEDLLHQKDFLHFDFAQCKLAQDDIFFGAITLNNDIALWDKVGMTKI